MLGKIFNPNRSLCIRIFDIMSLIYNQHGKLQAIVQLEITCRFVGCYSRAAGLYPRTKSRKSPGSMNLRYRKPAEFTNFTAPIFNDTGRTYDNEMRTAGIP